VQQLSDGQELFSSSHEIFTRDKGAAAAEEGSRVLCH